MSEEAEEFESYAWVALAAARIYKCKHERVRLIDADGDATCAACGAYKYSDGPWQHPHLVAAAVQAWEKV